MASADQKPEDETEYEAEAPYYEDELERRSGFSFRVFLLTGLVSVGVVAAALYALWVSIERGQVDRFRYMLRDVRLVPDSEAALPTAGEGFRVYYTRDGIKLTPYLHTLAPGATPQERHRLILNEALADPPPGPFQRAVPPETALRGFYVSGRTAYVDLSEDFLDAEELSPLRERLAVYAIVNTLVLNNPDIDAVQILVEGEARETAWGWLDTSSPLGANLGTIEEL